MRTKRPLLSNQEFLERVREYLPMEASAWSVDGQGNPVGNGLFAELHPGAFYVFDNEAIAALTHAVEDVALDEARGSLIASFQQFANFSPHRERYWQLGATVDDVLVLGAGRTPRRHGHLRFQNIGRRALADFRLVLFEGRRDQILLMAQQRAPIEGSLSPEPAFLGFYTLDPGWIRRIRDQVLDVASGKEGFINEFARLRTIDLATKRIESEFLREKEAVAIALRKLQGDGAYDSESFVLEFDRSLGRLQQWRTRLPEMLGRGPQPVRARSM